MSLCMNRYYVCREKQIFEVQNGRKRLNVLAHLVVFRINECACGDASVFWRTPECASVNGRNSPPSQRENS